MDSCVEALPCIYVIREYGFIQQGTPRIYLHEDNCILTCPRVQYVQCIDIGC